MNFLLACTPGGSELSLIGLTILAVIGVMMLQCLVSRLCREKGA